VCSSQTAAGALLGAKGPNDEGGADQGLHLPPRSTHLLQAGARQGSQAGTTFLLAFFSIFDLAVSCAAATSVVINPLTLQADFYQTTSNA